MSEASAPRRAERRTRVGEVSFVPDAVTARWDAATSGLAAPLVVLDLDAYEANAADLVRRAAGRPIRVASKSLRCRWVLRDVLARPGFAGVMGYSVAEAAWLVREGVHDVYVAYPTATRRRCGTWPETTSCAAR